MASPLENLSGPGKPLKKEAPDAKEFSGLKRAALARLSDSAKSINSLESRFDLAYNAAHALTGRVHYAKSSNCDARHWFYLHLHFDPHSKAINDANEAIQREP